MSDATPTAVQPTTNTSWLVVGGLFAVFVLEALIVAAVHVSAGLSLLFFFGVTLAAYKALVGEQWAEVIGLFVLYTGLILAAYYVNLATFPEYHGFTAAEVAGTDDSYFYSLVAESISTTFPAREWYWIRDHPYAILMRALTPVPINHPFDVLFVNAIGATFIPIFTRLLATELTGDRRVARMAFWMVAFGPFLWTNSIVLVRDGWTAALFMGSIFFFLRQDFGRSALLAALLFFLRIASGLQLILVIGMITLGIVIQFESRKRKLLYASVVAVGVVGAAVFVYPAVMARLQNLEAQSVFALLVRENFIETLQSMDPGTFLAQINQQPYPIRLPVAFLFFLTFPFFTPEDVFIQGSFVWRSFLICVYSIVFVVYFKFLVQGIMKGVKVNMTTRMFVISVLASVLLLSQASMQIRHKTMIIPALYVIAAYGYYHATEFQRQIGWFGLFGILSINVLKFLLGI